MSEELQMIQTQIRENIESLIKKDKLMEAKKLLSQYMGMVKDDPEAFSMQAVIAIQEGQLEDSEKVLQQGLLIFPDDFALQYNLGYVYETTGNYAKAFKLYKHLNTQYPEKNDLITEAIERIHEKQPCTKLQKMAFVCLNGLDSFIHDIANEMCKEYEVKKFIVSKEKEIYSAVDWADILWLEWGNDSTVLATSYKGIIGKKVIVRIHGYEVFTDIPPKIKWAVVDRLVFVAEHKRDLFFSQFGEIIARDKTCILRNGIDSNKFNIAVNKTKNKNIACIGNINYRKGIDLLLQFFYELLQVDGEYKLYIRGTHQDARYQLAIDTMIKELGLQNHVIFVGRVEDINKWLANMTYIVSSSLEESFHYSIGEGMLAGLKPIVHAWTESRDIWPQEYIFKNSAEFKQIILDSSYNPTEYRQFVLDHYALSKQMGEIHDIITTSK